MKKALSILLAAATLAACCPTSVKSTRIERAPEGTVDTKDFPMLFRDVAINGGVNSVHSLMVLKDGKVVYEQYDYAHDANCLHVMWSASKTFTATAVGFACQDGLMSVDDLVADYFAPEELGEDPDGYFKELTVKDLLIMSSGLKMDYIASSAAHKLPSESEATLKGGWEFEPGTKFRYNSMNTYLAGMIVTKVTGKRLSDYLNEKLFEPLGIREYQWEQSEEGYDFGGWGLFLSIENFAKMGQFFLQKGSWNGKQLLSEEWIDEATSAHIYQNGGVREEGNEWGEGYCYQMWRCSHNAVRLDGAWGQFCIIIPDKNAVVAIHENTSNTYATLQSVWERIYPAL